MKWILSAAMFLFLAGSLTAQDLVGDKAEQMFGNQSYQELIDFIGNDTKKFSAKTRYFVGMSYYMLGNDEMCQELMQQTIKEDGEYVEAYYAMGTSLNYTGRPEEAIDYFLQAILLDSTAAQFYGGLADSYYLLGEVDEAITNYSMATSLKGCPDRPFSMLPKLLLANGQEDEALAAFYDARQHVRPGSDDYKTALYNIGLIEFLRNNFSESESALTELLMLDPEDFEAYVTMIQLYHLQGRYDETDLMSEQLRKAYELGMLPESIGGSYTIDHFNWESNNVIATERFAKPPDLPYYKYQFNFFENEEFLYNISVQHNLDSESEETKYVLVKDMNGRHYEYEVWFSESMGYHEVREAVLDLLEQ